MAIRYACAFLLAAPLAFGQSVPSAGLTYSTYLRDGFAPSSVTTDAAGNVYLAGSVVVDSSSGHFAAMVVKLNPSGTHYIYARTLGGSLNDTGAAIAVDSAGNAYVTGTANSPDFPVTPGRQLATPPSGTGTPGLGADARAFVAKLDPQGSLLFSELLGGSIYNIGSAAALTAQGEILVSGVANSGFAVTAGAFSATGKDPRPYLLELDPTGATVKFSAFGIGGSALATDSSGNIYMAGSTLLLDYPTTPGAYQPSFRLVTICYGLCQIAFPATNQYLTKVDSTASKLIYSTAVAGGGQTTNAGLAVDAAGNAYLTGLTFGGYPYTATAPNSPQIRPFLTKIDAAGQHALFSVAAGGAGVALDQKGHVVVGGSYNNANLSGRFPLPEGLLPGLPAGVAALPEQCQENDVTTASQAYISQVDSGSGNVLSTVLVDASNLHSSGVALAGSSVWVAGIAQQADVPITPGALKSLPLKTGSLLGAYLGETDFSLAPPPSGAPAIACVMNAANTSRSGPAAIGQLLSLFGSNLGPAQGVGATDNSSTSLGGVSVTFDGNPAPILYASSSQINLAVPYAVGGQDSTVMQVSVNGVQAPPRELPLAPMAPTVFANLTTTEPNCSGGTSTFAPAIFVPVALYADGSPNSCKHPATPGTVVSFFLNGLGGEIKANLMYGPGSGLNTPVLVQIGSWSAEVVDVAQVTPFVWRVDVAVPPLPPGTGFTQFNVQFFINSDSGPLPAGPIGIGALDVPPDVPDSLYVWVGPH